MLLTATTVAASTVHFHLGPYSPATPGCPSPRTGHVSSSVTNAMTPTTVVRSVLFHQTARAYEVPTVLCVAIRTSSTTSDASHYWDLNLDVGAARRAPVTQTYSQIAWCRTLICLQACGKDMSVRQLIA